jgi:hypothetical protein
LDLFLNRRETLDWTGVFRFESPDAWQNHLMVEP